jgi:hypothetical protein
MGRLAKLLSFTRVFRHDTWVSDVKVDPGGGFPITPEDYAPAGDDSYPLETDFANIESAPHSGGAVVTGYVDPINEPKALKGDKRIYGRNSDSGVSVIEVWLKNDGTALVSNANGSLTLRPDGSQIGENSNGSFELETGGDFVVNGVTIDTSGNIDSPATITAPNLSGTTSVKAATKELAGHDHLAGTPPGNTGPNN